MTGADAIGGGADTGRARLPPGSVGCIPCMWRPHCWQYAKPTGVGVPQRGHVIVLPAAAGGGPPGIAIGPGGKLVGACGGAESGGGIGIGPPAMCGGGVMKGPGGGMAIAPRGDAEGGLAIGPPGGIPIGIGGATSGGGAPPVDASALPQLRQNFMPGGFSPRQTPHTLGNPGAPEGVCANEGASELPQFRQNDDPDGLSWPHIEQRIGPLTLKPSPVSQHRGGTGMAPGRFATHRIHC